MLFFFLKYDEICLPIHLLTLCQEQEEEEDCIDATIQELKEYRKEGRQTTAPNNSISIRTNKKAINKKN